MAMNAEHAHPVVAVLFLIVAVAMAAPVSAQEEPTPVPEPAQEEPAAKPEATAPAEEPAAEPEIKEAEVPIVYRDKTQITINGRAEMNGYIELIVQPNNEDPTKVRANIVAKTKTKKITKELVSQLVFGLGDRYTVKQTGDKTIMVKRKNKKVPPVSISLMTQNLAGVSVMIGQG
jgi:hemolysin activation/secretion protein